MARRSFDPLIKKSIANNSDYSKLNVGHVCWAAICTAHSDNSIRTGQTLAPSDVEFTCRPPCRVSSPQSPSNGRASFGRPLAGEDQGGGSRRPARRASGGAFDHLSGPRDPPPLPAPTRGAGAPAAIDSAQIQQALGEMLFQESGSAAPGKLRRVTVMSVMWKQGYSGMPPDAPAPLIQAARTVR